MERGTAFLRTQVNHAAMQHQTFVEQLGEHERFAADDRYRALCARFLVKATSHQQLLRAYLAEMGVEARSTRTLLGKALGVAGELADLARESDYKRLLDDLAMARQSEDTFRTFRDSGRTLGLTHLAALGELGARDHVTFATEAHALVQQLFVELVRQGDNSGLHLGPVARVPATSGPSAPSSL